MLKKIRHNPLYSTCSGMEFSAFSLQTCTVSAQWCVAMPFIIDKEALKSGLIIFRRGDVAHRNFYCRIKLPKEDRYKTIALDPFPIRFVFPDRISKGLNI
jgi:hypothetical protein